MTSETVQHVIDALAPSLTVFITWLFTRRHLNTMHRDLDERYWRDLEDRMAERLWYTRGQDRRRKDRRGSETRIRDGAS